MLLRIGWMLRRTFVSLCMTAIYCATEAKTNHRHSERSEESRIKIIVLIIGTFVLSSCQRQGRGGIQRGRVTWSDLATSGNLPRCVATRGKRFEVSFRKKAGGQLENFATLKQSPNRHIAPTQITIVQPDGWLLGCGECNQLPTKK